MQILGVLSETAAPTMRLAVPNFTTGFHAASLDLGRLQDVLGRGIARFDAKLLEERWDEALGWMRAALRTWVQRYKRVRIERRSDGVHVAIETQDDYGYYSYAFDVLRSRPRKTAKRSR